MDSQPNNSNTSNNPNSGNPRPRNRGRGGKSQAQNSSSNQSRADQDNWRSVESGNSSQHRPQNQNQSSNSRRRPQNSSNAGNGANSSSQPRPENRNRNRNRNRPQNSENSRPGQSQTLENPHSQNSGNRTDNSNSNQSSRNRNRNRNRRPQNQSTVDNGDGQVRQETGRPRPRNNNQQKNQQKLKKTTEKLNDLKISQKSEKLPKIRPPKNINLDELDQRSRLIHELSYEIYECMICCNNIKRNQAIWTCQTCHAIFHIHCIKKWSSTKLRESAAIENNNNYNNSRGDSNNFENLNNNSNLPSQFENGVTVNGNFNRQESQESQEQSISSIPWKCPGCQTSISTSIARKYDCFCGKLHEPRFNPNYTPHSCGEICGKASKICGHSCSELCHPGPCPPCPKRTLQICPCDEQKQTYVKCIDLAKNNQFTCGETCGRILNCGLHFCDRECHFGKCPPCNEKIEVTCFSHGETKIANCGSPVQFTCEKTCGKILPCGHTCDFTCHNSECPPCKINANKTCHCGNKIFENWTCLEPRLSCQKKCNKKKLCGHNCKEICHPGDCDPCPEDSMNQKKCQCGKSKIRVYCKDIVANSGKILCGRICKKVADCGNPRHICGKECCIDCQETGRPPACLRPCTNKLTCGQHSCPEICHYGRNCLPCSNVIWHELSCHCGVSRVLPPIACGADISITCHLDCPIERDCGHKGAHKCHDAREDCPPCTAIVMKACMCGKTPDVKTICYRQNESVSCGKICGEQLDCGHICQKPCHDHAAYVNSPTFHCTQPCKDIRSDCGHVCGQPCHKNLFEEEDCDLSQLCRVLVKVNCDCGFKNKIIECRAPGTSTALSQLPFNERAGDCYYKLMKANQRKAGMRLKPIKQSSGIKTNSYSTVLLCDEECEKNKRLMGLRDALEVSDLKHNITYPEWMVKYAANNASFVLEVENIFRNLIAMKHDAPDEISEHMFKPMPKHKRRLIHELAALYGFDGFSYNPEPHRYCHICTSNHSTKMSLPEYLLSQVAQNELEQKNSDTTDVDLALYKSSLDY